MCTEDGVWGGWSNWTQCPVTCGGGLAVRVRQCIGPFNGGAPCNGTANDTMVCNTQPCPGTATVFCFTEQIVLYFLLY